MKKIDKDVLKSKLDMLHELKNIRSFLAYDDDDYTINIKREHFDKWFFTHSIFNKKITTDVDTLKTLVNLAISKYEEDIEEYIGVNNENSRIK